MDGETLTCLCGDLLQCTLQEFPYVTLIYWTTLFNALYLTAISTTLT